MTFGRLIASLLARFVGLLPDHVVDGVLRSIVARRAERLPAVEAGRFLMQLDHDLYGLHGLVAIRHDDGVHVKHRLTKYHDFFLDRVPQGSRVLDIGCGDGSLALDLADVAEAVVGIDLEGDKIAAAQHRAAARDNCTFVVGDATTDAIEGGPFDVLVLSNVLEHIAERPAFLRALVAWHRPDRVLIRVPARDRDWRVPYKAELGVEWRLDPTHETEYVRGELEADCQDGGLVVDEVVSAWGELWVAASRDVG